MFCWFKLHNYSLVREIDYKKYLECSKCKNRIVIANDCDRKGKNNIGSNSLADTEWLKGERDYPRSTLEILGPKPKLRNR